jgi:hypothetical protein
VRGREWGRIHADEAGEMIAPLLTYRQGRYVAYGAMAVGEWQMGDKRFMKRRNVLFLGIMYVTYVCNI